MSRWTINTQGGDQPERPDEVPPFVAPTPPSSEGSAHERAISAAATELNMRWGFVPVTHRMQARAAIAAYLTTLKADPEVVEQMARAIHAADREVGFEVPTFEACDVTYRDVVYGEARAALSVLGVGE